MKKTTLLFTLFLFLQNLLLAQIENEPCTAFCLPFSGTVTAQNADFDGFSPNSIMPCGGGNTEDNPVWYTFIAAKPTFTIAIKSYKCIYAPLELTQQLTVFEGKDCNNLQAIGCLNATVIGTLTVPVQPCKQYWIQVDGIAEAVCEFVLTYNPNQLLKTVPPPIINGATVVCAGAAVDYTASFPDGTCADDVWKWTATPKNAANIVKSAAKASIFFNAPSDVTVCAKPELNIAGACPSFVGVESCMVVKAGKISPVACDVKLCPKEMPFSYDFGKCIKNAYPYIDSLASPTIEVETPAGVKKNYAFNFQDKKTGCSGGGIITVSAPKSDTFLGIFEIAPCDSIKIGNQWWSAKNISHKKQFQTVGTTKIDGCDSTYSYFLKPKSGVAKHLGHFKVRACDSIKIVDKWYNCADASTDLQYLIKPKNKSAACDSIFSFTLQCTKNDTIFLGNRVVCGKDSLKIGDKWFKNSNVSPNLQYAKKTFPNNKDCDVTYSFVLTAGKTTTTSLGKFQICETDSVNILGKWYKCGDAKKSTQYVTKPAIAGIACDSIFAFVLECKKIDTLDWGNVKICKNQDSLQTKGKWFYCKDAKEDTQYWVEKLPNAICPKVNKVKISCINSDTLDLKNIFTCENDSVKYEGIWFKCKDAAPTQSKVIPISKTGFACDRYARYTLICLEKINISIKVSEKQFPYTYSFDTILQKKFPMIPLQDYIMPLTFTNSTPVIGTNEYVFQYAPKDSDCEGFIVLTETVIKLPPPPTSVKQVDRKSKTTVNIRPNPFDTDLTIMIENADNQSFTIDLIDVLGRKMASKAVFADKTTTAVRFENLQFLERGFYIVVVRDEYGKVVMKKVVKE
jgi:Secretion system C-terminal sorting domain